MYLNKRHRAGPNIYLASEMLSCPHHVYVDIIFLISHL